MYLLVDQRTGGLGFLLVLPNFLSTGAIGLMDFIIPATLVCQINVPARLVFFVFLPAGTFISTRHDPMFTSTRHDYLGNILSSNVPACQMPSGTLFPNNHAGKNVDVILEKISLCVWFPS